MLAGLGAFCGVQIPPGWAAVGQTLAAHDLCTGIKPYRKRHHVQTGVGHYGVFNGRKWNNEIYPLVRDFIHFSD